jgi:hypothetical protein
MAAVCSEMDSGLDFEIASEMALVCSQMIRGMVSKLEMPSKMPSGSILNDRAGVIERDPCCLSGSVSLLITVLFETDIITVPKEGWAHWKRGYNYPKV